MIQLFEDFRFLFKPQLSFLWINSQIELGLQEMVKGIQSIQSLGILVIIIFYKV